MAGTEKGWIMTTFLPEQFSNFPGLNTLKDDYNLVSWSDFLKNQDQYSEKIRVIITYPMAVTPELWTEQMLGKMKNLRAVSTLSIGVDHINIPLLKKLGIKLGHAVGTTKDTTADHAFCLLMTAARRIPELMECSRGYKEGEKFSVGRNQRRLGTDIHEMVLGIVGMGEIGFEVAKRAQGFRMRVLYHNRNRRSPEDEETVNATYCPTLGDLLPHVDYLVISAPLTESTVNMMSREQFSMMKPSAFVINVARGGLVNTNDLADALQNKLIAGAALDVTEPEPLPDSHPLHQMPNVYITPHAAMLTTQGTARICMKTAENTRAAMESKPMPGEFKSSL